MTETRLFQLIKSLDAAEMRELKRAVRSPFFNNRKDVQILYAYLELSIKKNRRPTKERAFAKMHPGKKYDDHPVRLAMSFLKKLTERFLVQKEVFEDEAFVDAKLAAVFRKRQLAKMHEKTVKTATEKLEKQSRRDSKILENQLDFQLEEFQRKVALKRTGELNLQELSNQIDNIFIAKKFKQTCLLLSHQSVYKKDYDFGLLSEVIEKTEREKLYEIPAIGMYYFAWKTLTNPTQVAHFQQFKKMVFEKGDLFPSDEMRDLTILAINFCIKKYNEGNREFLDEEFEIYKEGLAKKYFINNNQISRFTYRNIVSVAMVLKEFDWAKQFLNEYKIHLDPKYRETTFKFNFARLQYEQKNYDSALDLLRSVEADDLLVALSTRTMFLKIFYETDAYDLLPSYIASLQTFIRRKKNIGYHKDLYLNFSTFFIKMINLPPGDRAAKKALAAQLENIEKIAERTWLMRQLKGSK